MLTDSMKKEIISTMEDNVKGLIENDGLIGMAYDENEIRKDDIYDFIDECRNKMLSEPSIKIEDEAGGYAIVIDGKRFKIDDEDDRSLLVKMFECLGFKNVAYEEVY
jgi:hypothetical protein